MHKVLDIHLAGHAEAHRVHEDAYSALTTYLEGARSRLAADPDSAEVLDDLERSIGSKLADRLGPDKRILTLDDVSTVLDEIGPVEADDGRQRKSEPVRPRRRRLYRIREGQQVAGVCTGIAAYSEIGIDWIRTIVILLTLVTAGVFLLVYFAVAFLLPVAPTRDAWIAQMAAEEGT